MLNDDTVKVLNGLVQISEDGKKGFAEAAQETKTPELKTMFQQRSQDCAAAVTELQAPVKSLGGEPKDSGTFAGAAHRGWTKVKATIGDANISTLEEVESAEDTAKAAYAKALTAALPEPVRVVVQRQYEGAVRNHDLIRDLRNSYKAKKEAVAG
jgi:uncharacterized protein (TIGR02284 family)